MINKDAEIKSSKVKKGILIFLCALCISVIVCACLIIENVNKHSKTITFKKPHSTVDIVLYQNDYTTLVDYGKKSTSVDSITGKEVTIGFSAEEDLTEDNIRTDIKRIILENNNKNGSTPVISYEIDVSEIITKDGNITIIAKDNVSAESKLDYAGNITCYITENKE